MTTAVAPSHQQPADPDRASEGPSPPQADAALVFAALSGLGLDVTGNADGTAIDSMPTTLVVDSGGRLPCIDVHPELITRSVAADVVAAVDGR